MQITTAERKLLARITANNLNKMISKRYNTMTIDEQIESLEHLAMLLTYGGS